MLKAVIIEDIPVAREALKRDIDLHCPEIIIEGMAEGVVSGAKLIRKYDPDIIFLDVELKDGNGFDLLDILSDHKGKVIFTTASEHYAIRAFRFAAIDYLLKPIQVEQLKESIQKAIQYKDQEKLKQYEMIKDQLSDHKKNSKIALHTQEKIIVRELDEILYCNSSSNYSNFFFTDGSQFLVTRTLKEFELMLSDRGFIRTHQSYLVNTIHIKAYIKKDGGSLTMSNGDILPVSFRKRAEVMKALSIIG